jgi:hypothetical protein
MTARISSCPSLRMTYIYLMMCWRRIRAAHHTILQVQPYEFTGVFPADIELDILEQKPDEDNTVSEGNSNNSSDRYRLARSGEW